MQITITIDTDDVAALTGAVGDALFAAEAANEGSAELATLHGALLGLQDYYTAALPEVHKGAYQPQSGGGKPPPGTGGGS